MTNEEIKQLIDKYMEGETNLQEEQVLRDYFQSENIPGEFRPVADQFRYFEEMNDADPPKQFDAFAKIDFYDAKISPFEGEKRRRRRGMMEKEDNRKFNWLLRIAAGFALLIIGFAAGHFTGIGKTVSTRPINPDIQKMQAALVNPFDESQPSAGKRMAAINITEKIPVNNHKMARQASEVLIYTMNNDENVNVRLAALEALLKYQNEVPVKPALIHSLTRQTDPLMQITLIHMLVKLKAKGAIPAMQQLLVSTDTGKLVREHLQVGIAKLQTRKPSST